MADTAPAEAPALEWWERAYRCLAVQLMDAQEASMQASGSEVSENASSQQEEELAMQAIFGDELSPLVPQPPAGAASSSSLVRVRSLDEGLVVPSFSISVQLAPLASPLTGRIVSRSRGGRGTAEAPASDAAGPSSSSSSVSPPESDAASVHIRYEFAVSHLPPLRVALAFPSGYPSRCPPVAALGADWLSHGQLCRLAAGLLREWESAKGEVAVFRWVDWLKENALSEVVDRETGALLLETDFDEADREGGGGGPDGSDDWSQPASSGASFVGVVAEESAPERIAMVLLAHDARAARARFYSEPQECLTCFDTATGKDLADLGCLHPCCRPCLARLVQVNVKDGSLAQLVCPEPSCRAPVPPSVLREVLSEEDFLRWERIALERALAAMPDLEYCPRCTAAVLKEPGPDPLGQCASCMFAFCCLCKDSWHPGRGCMGAVERTALLDRRLAMPANKEVDRIRLIRAKQDMASEALITQRCKTCPRCTVPIVKDGGCEKVTCGICGCLMCWKCGADVSHVGYGHFDATPGGCPLFDDAEVERIRLLELADRRRNRDLREPPAGWNAREIGPYKPCPHCRARVARLDNNNHIQCWRAI